MNEVRCIEPERVGELVALPDSHPLREHVRACPRCSALLDEYRLFMAMNDPDEGADPESADAILSAVVSHATREAAPAPRAAAPPPPEPARRGWTERLFHPALRPAWAFAVVAVAIGGVLLWPRLASPPVPGILRGEAGRGAAGFVLERAEAAPSGVLLAWRSFPGAQHYQARFLTMGLRETGRSPETPDTTLFFPAGGLPARAARGDTLLVRVVALAGVDVVAISPPRAIIAP